MSTPVKPTALNSGLIAVKSRALGATATTGPVRSMTLKLDDARYRQLKQLGLDKNKTSQDLLSKAVDILLAEK